MRDHPNLKRRGGRKQVEIGLRSGHTLRVWVQAIIFQREGEAFLSANFIDTESDIEIDATQVVYWREVMRGE